MSTVEVLKAARQLIEDQNRWTRNYFARDSEGCEAPPLSKRAVCWCAEGAVMKVARKRQLFLRTTKGILRDAIVAIYGDPRIDLPTVNDFRGHDSVMQVYDKAIELAEAQQ